MIHLTKIAIATVAIAALAPVSSPRSGAAGDTPKRDSDDLAMQCFYYKSYYWPEGGDLTCWDPGGSSCMVCKY